LHTSHRRAETAVKLTGKAPGTDVFAGDARLQRVPQRRSTAGIGTIPGLKAAGHAARRLADRPADSESRSGETGLHAPALAFANNRFRVDALVSYQPTPGTLVFAGCNLSESEGLRFGNLRRTNDRFFLKISCFVRV
jgi:hypothetical protein